MFRGREVTHPERGTMILDRLAEELAELGVVEQRPLQEGRNMTMMLAPSKAVLAGRAEAHEAGHETLPDGSTADGAVPNVVSEADGAAPNDVVSATDGAAPDVVSETDGAAPDVVSSDGAALDSPSPDSPSLEAAAAAPNGASAEAAEQDAETATP